MLEQLAMVALLVFIMGVGILSLDQLKRWAMASASEAIDLWKKWELARLQVEEKRLELEEKFTTYNSEGAK